MSTETAPDPPSLTTAALSYSRASDYNKCNYYYYLKREYRDDEGRRLVPAPAAWLPNGIGVHAAIEAYEKSGRTMPAEVMTRVFTQAWDKSVAELMLETPVEDWYWSGPYAPIADLNRRFKLGTEQTLRYRQFTKGRSEKVWLTPEGQPGVELKLRVPMDGFDLVVVIDDVLVNARNRIEVRDHKTGRNPGDPLQLATAATCLKLDMDVDVESGHFWMARTGKTTEPVAMLDWPASRVEDAYGDVLNGIATQSFDPNPSPDNCGMCDMAKYCDFAQYS